ncbi:MAG: helix-turn-helix transcriptional regulator [Patescibacteria group bacterium]
MPVIIHNLVQQYRIQRSLTQEELGNAIGVTRQTIIAIEKGNYTPSVLLALKMADFFETTVEKLFTIQEL